MQILRNPPPQNILKCNGLVFKSFTLDPTHKKKLLFVLKIINGRSFSNTTPLSLRIFGGGVYKIFLDTTPKIKNYFS